MKKRWVIIGVVVSVIAIPLMVRANLIGGIMELLDLSPEEIKYNYTYESKTNCTGNVCTAEIGQLYAYDIDNKWKPIEQALSLRNSSITCDIVSDWENLIECLDWNTTSITLSLSLNESATSLNNIPIRIWNERNNLTYSILINFDSKMQRKNFTIPFRRGYMVEFGENSSYATLNNPTEDAYVEYDPMELSYYETGGNYLYASYVIGYIDRFYVEWDVSSIPDTATIEDVDFKYHGQARNGDCHIHAMGNKPSTRTAQQNYVDTADGTVYADVAGFPVVGTNQEIDLGTTADSNLKTALTSGDWFAIGVQLDSESGTKSSAIYAEEYASTPDPTLYVTYSTDTTPPTFSNCHQNVTNNTAIAIGTPIYLGCKWTDNYQLSKYVNSSKINTSGSWANGTWQSFSAGNWTNFTVIFPSAQGSNITVKIYANDTANNQKVTGAWFWWNVTAPEEPEECWTCDSVNHVLFIPTGCVYEVLDGEVSDC